MADESVREVPTETDRTSPLSEQELHDYRTAAVVGLSSGPPPGVVLRMLDEIEQSRAGADQREFDREVDDALFNVVRYWAENSGARAAVAGRCKPLRDRLDALLEATDSRPRPSRREPGEQVRSACVNCATDDSTCLDSIESTSSRGCCERCDHLPGAGDGDGRLLYSLVHNGREWGKPGASQDRETLRFYSHVATLFLTRRSVPGQQDPDGAALIAAERRRQVQAEGYTPEHDDQHAERELLRAAAVYTRVKMPEFWPWPGAPRLGGPTFDADIRDLVKAGALIAAEIDRRARLADQQDGGPR